MSSLITMTPMSLYQSLRRFSVSEYHQMIQTGILDDADKVELLEGHVVLKMPRNPPHDGTLDLVHDAVGSVLPVGWILRTQQAVTLNDSEPEPDFTLARGNKRTYLTHHPGPADVGQLIEVSDSSLDRDRNDKTRIYANAGIPIYWIVNLVDRQIEVYTNPSGPIAAAGYAQRQDFDVTMHVPLIVDGVLLAKLAVVEMLP